jgi:hypothetical protein
MGVRFSAEQDIFSFRWLPDRLWVPPPIEWVPGGSFSEVKQPEREPDHSPSSNTEVKIGEAITPLPHMSSWRGA